MAIYRGPVESLRMRCESLRSELEQTAKRVEELEPLRRKRRELARELAEAERALALASGKAPSPVRARGDAASAVLGVAGLVVTGVLTAAIGNPKVPDASPSLAAEGIEVMMLPSQPQPEARIRLALRAMPPETTWTLDGGSDRLDYLSNPLVTTRPRDALVHRVRASAPGYRDRTFAVRFDDDITLSVDLERDGAHAPRRNAIGGNERAVRIPPDTGDPPWAP